MNPELVILSDDAGQFRVLLHALCWIHAERVLAKLVGFNDEQRTALERVRTAVWELYRELQAYRTAPTAEARATLTERFVALCATRTGFTSLDLAMQRMGRHQGELLLVEAPKPEPPSEPVLDFLVRVDRSVKPSYPDWMKKLEHPELECSGPAEYNLQTAVEQWLHDDQKNGSVQGNTIYKSLQKGNALATCLNLQDGLAIQQKGIAVFRKLFAGKAVFLWGSVVQYRNGRLNVPYLSRLGGKVVVRWLWLDCGFSSDDPALRFGK